MVPREKTPQNKNGAKKNSRTAPWHSLEKRWWKKWSGHDSHQYWMALFGIIFLAGTTYLVLPAGPPSIISLKPGDIASRNYRATEDVLIEDEEATMRRIEEVVRSARPIYDMDGEAPVRNRTDLAAIFERARKLIEEPEGETADDGTRINLRSGKNERERIILDRIEKSFKRTFGVELPEDVMRPFLKDGFTQETEEILGRVLGGVLARGVVSNKALLRNAENGIIVRYLLSDKEELIPNPMELIDTIQAAEIMERDLAEYMSDKDLRRAALKMAGIIIQPNLTLNKTETEKRLAEAKENVKSVFIQVKSGEIIVRDGEKITAEQILKLHKIFPAGNDTRHFNRIAGFLILNILMMLLVWIFLSGYHPEVLRSRTDLAMLLTLFFLTLIVSRINFEMAKPINTTFPSLNVDALYYGLPVTFAPWLAAMLVSTPVAFIMAVFCSFYASIIISGGTSYLLAFSVTSLLAAYLGSKCHQRATFFKIGLFLGILNAGLIISYQMTRQDFLAPGTFQSVIFGFMSGSVAALIVTGILPVLEHIFKKTTDIKLLELSNPAQPLLKRVVLEAPGTYHHSIMVGNLAESAAELIGARPLLARIASYYHDIGKIKKPDYFIENNRDGVSRHDMLSPRMSSLILISHVKEGIELGREYNLPEVIIKAIREHHGTSLITYFFKKAKEQENPTLGSIKESEFRYPGTKPQTRENAIIMLADQVEAACRALPDQSPSRIQGVVRRIVNNIYMDGQLNECDLTLRDLEIIQEQFTHVLVGTYHQRPDYPVLVNGKFQEQQNDGDKKSSKERKG